MAGKKAGSDGQIRKTTAEWAADTGTYLEGMRLMNTDTGSIRISKGTTYALAWQPSGGAVTSDDVSDESGISGQSVTEALQQLNSLVGNLDTALDTKQDHIRSQVILNDQSATRDPSVGTYIAQGADNSYLGAEESAPNGSRFTMKCKTTAPYYFVFTPYGSGTVDGAESVTLYPDQSGTFECIGSDNWTAIVKPQPVQYRVVLSTADPGAATPMNDFPMAFAWTNPITGRWTITANSGAPFITGRTFASVTPDSSVINLTHSIEYVDQATIDIRFNDGASGDLADPGGFTFMVQVG